MLKFGFFRLIFEAYELQKRKGRAKQNCRSAHQRYNIEVVPDEQGKVAIDLKWEKDLDKEQLKAEGLGKYFLRTSMQMEDKVVIWNVYNTIREVESTFRTLKTDLRFAINLSQNR